MLRPPNSRLPFFGVFTEDECPRCHRQIQLPLGEVCRECREDIALRAARIARLVAAGTTIMVAIYAMVVMPTDSMSRMVGAMSVVVWYILVNLVVRRVLNQYLT